MNGGLEFLAGAVDDAMQPAVGDAATAVVLAAIAGSGQPTDHPVVMVEAVYKAVNELCGYWSALADQVSAIVDGRGDRSEIEDLRWSVEHMSGVANGLVDQLVASPAP